MKILIVDDEPKIRKGLCKIVEMHPGWYVPQAFADAESAIAFLRDNGADVVITDIHMPGLTGLDMIEQMRSACPKVVFIILTGYGKFEYAQRAIDLGVKKYLMKPTSPNEITAALEQIEADTPRKKHAAAFQKPTNNLIILRAMEYVDLHYRDRFTLRDMAAALYISPNYLSDLFKKNTGMRLSDYITEVRLEKAREYLMDVHYKVRDVSTLVGISDPRYFSSVFRKKYGMTPMEFRNEYASRQFEEPDPEELEDSFLRYAGDVKASRKESTAYHLSGTPERDGYKNLITMMLSAQEVRACAKSRGLSVTELLCAAMMQAILDLQAEKVRDPRRRKPVKVLVPVNLRGLFPSRTLRNFASYITPELDPRMGECSFKELCGEVHHRMGLENNRRTMRAKFAANVASERSPVLRVMPLFIKNIAMKAVFDAVGERKSCLCLSNLGNVQLPEAMAAYVRRMDFIIGVQAAAPHDCGVVTWNGTMYINCIRSIREPELEMHFYRVLRKLGLHVTVESNQR